MRITDIRTHAVHVNHRGDWIFVEVVADNGLSGLGEASHSTDDRFLRLTIEALRPQLAGADPHDIEATFRRTVPRNAGMARWTAFSAIEQACWDLAGKEAGLPVYKLLGGQVGHPIRLYANINRAARDRDPRAYAEVAAQAVAAGFRAVKCAPFDDVSWRTLDHPEGRHALDRGLERIRCIREAIGDDIELSVDCHGRFDVATAIRVARLLETFRLYWLEEPVADDEPTALLQIKAHLATRLTSGEGLLGRQAYLPMLQSRAVDVAMIDLKHTGGLLEGKKIAAIAEAYGIAVSPHSPSGPIASIATAHLCATLPNFLTLEYAWGEAPWRNDLVGGSERIENGCLILGDAPGFGVTLDDAVLRAHAVGL